MDIPTKYDPAKTEDRWYNYWLEHELFKSVPDEREPYTIVIPPPNVTGVLHMGHMLNNTIQDILVRRARMKGFNACWVPGTDHASIATEARVVAKLAAEGINKASLSREDFLKHAWEWKEKHGGIILEQLKKLGASCDWERTKFTMDDDMSESVINVFIDLYNKGLIYRGVRMVNWDPAAKTAVSDEEVIYREVKSALYYVRYKIHGEDEWLTIATTRPETILGDTAVAVNPSDERFKHLHGKEIHVPMTDRVVPIVKDEYVEMDFGTGALKITPAHDINDYEIGIRHKLQSIDIFNDDGTLNEKAGLFVGVDRFEARQLAVDKLREEGHLVKIEDYMNKLGFSERTDAVIEPKLSIQWFLKMKDMAAPALESVMKDDIRLYPLKFKNTYRHWMENVKDWCISRQLWWGHRIPAWYLPDGDHVIAASEDEAYRIARERYPEKSINEGDLSQDEDVLDTWFSSWLWPISVFDGIRDPRNEDIRYYYPTDDLVTAPEILFFWVARMIIAGYEYMHEKPFKNVYLTGIVRDMQRRKMSKSLGNSPDPLDLIKKYSADGVRVGMLLCSPAGGDLLFDEGLPEQGRNFANKIWNAFRLVQSWKTDNQQSQPEFASLAIEWFEHKLNSTLSKLEEQFNMYRLSEALMTVYKLFWDDFSSWYLEAIKPEYGKPIDEKTYLVTVDFFDRQLKVLHPFMPFITEEIWQYLDERKMGESIMVQRMPTVKDFDNEILSGFDKAMETITAIRSVRREKNISLKEKIELLYTGEIPDFLEKWSALIVKLAGLSNILKIESKPDVAVSVLVQSNELFIPITGMIDIEAEIEKVRSEIEYQEGFLRGVMKKLGNEKFVNNAPGKVVEMERKKQADAETKLKILRERLDSLQK